MSSIFGKINFHQPISAQELFLMEGKLNHWDADDKEIWYDNVAGLGHLMLYNTPESLQEKLPFHDSDNQLTITADVRIDNREELCKKLAVDNKEKLSMPDSILILRAYQKYGEDCVKHLIGDFAFAIWDEREQKLFCARDQMGVKPFFYYIDEHFFAFASEKKGLLAIEELNKEENQDYLLKIVTHIHPDPEETLYHNIKRLTAGTLLSLNKSKLTIRSYWDLDETKEITYANSRDYLDNFLELFKESIKCRLRSAYPVGTELSGGLDSSGITCIAADLLHRDNREITSFSYGLLPEMKALMANEKTEEHFADEIIRFAQVDHPVKICGSGYSHFLEEADLSLFINDGPHNRDIWHQPVKKTAGNKGIRTLLSGFPGDELVTANNKMYVLELIASRNFIDYFKAARNVFGLISSIKLFLRTTLGPYVWPLLSPYLRNNQIALALQNNRNYLSSEYFKTIKRYIPPNELVIYFREAQKNKILASHVSERMELEDRSGLLYKVETRFPMADIRLIEYVLSLPYSEKMQPGRGRLLYRNAMTGILPTSIINRMDKTILMQPFTKEELFNCQKEIKYWLQQLEERQQIPAYINFKKLISEYSYGKEGNSIIKGSTMRKKIENIVRWKTKF
jgi:asparagine synthase (glutamine-hydrolysing)